MNNAKRTEQQAGIDISIELLQMAESAEKVIIDGRTYYTFILEHPGTAMRIIIGKTGWTLCPVDMPIQECLP